MADRDEQYAEFVRRSFLGLRFVLARIIEHLDDAGALSKQDLIADLKAEVDRAYEMQGSRNPVVPEVAMAEGVLAVLRVRADLREAPRN